jgi:hypothetical protein
VIKFWDFNAMDHKLQSFRTIEPETDVICMLNYSPSGGQFVMVCGEQDHKEKKEAGRTVEYGH